jgi:hypothetical protein
LTPAGADPIACRLPEFHLADGRAIGAGDRGFAYAFRWQLLKGRCSMQAQNVQHEAQETALKMIRLHGLRAQAIALERASEMRQQHDLAGHDQWQQIHAAICELRRTAPQETARG